MTVVINENGRVVYRFYDDRTEMTGSNVIKVDKNIILQEDSEYAFVNDVFIKLDYNKDDHKKYFEPALKDKLQNELKNLKKYLEDTDFVVSKYNELVNITHDMTDEEFKDKYSEILNKRSLDRKRINEIENQLTELK